MFGASVADRCISREIFLRLGHWHFAPQLARGVNSINHLHQFKCLFGIVYRRCLTADGSGKIAQLHFETAFAVMRFQRHSDELPLFVSNKVSGFNRSVPFVPKRMQLFDSRPTHAGPIGVSSVRFAAQLVSNSTTASFAKRIKAWASSSTSNTGTSTRCSKFRNTFP